MDPARTPLTLDRTPEGLAIGGRLDAPNAGRVWNEALELVRGLQVATLRIDASAVDYCDASGAAFLHSIARTQTAGGGRWELTGLRDEFREIFAMIEPSEASEEEAAPGGPLAGLESLGIAAREFASGLLDSVAFIGELVVGLVGLVRHPGQLRFKEVVLLAHRAGVGAVPIMALVGFLLGLILAFQSAIPMQRFGAQVFVADLLGISLLRELGPLLSAILLTARSGSAFAAEIGTMKVNEEVDALTTMGLDPMRFLILPRVVAAVIVVPVLSMLVTAAGLLGGLMMFLLLEFSPATYVERIAAAASLGDFVGGLAKASVFGVIVAAVGCQRGLQTGKGAGAVGLSTTSSVVTGITLIAVVDGLFAVVFYVLGW